jgi:hypothetical protein
MKNFLEWLESVEQKPILFVGNNSAIIPSDHEAGIKVPDQQNLQRLKPMAHSVYYEGIGEKGQGGGFESDWVVKNLGVKPNHVESYDQKWKMYSNCAEGLGPSILLFSNLNVNTPVDQNSVGGNNVEAVIRQALVRGGPEGSVPSNKVDEFIKICRAELGNKLDLDSKYYPMVAKEAESKMWPGGDSPGNGPLGQLADRIEKERRSMIVNAAKQNPGLYFLGSGHLISMQQEHGLPSDLEKIPDSEQAPQSNDL